LEQYHKYIGIKSIFYFCSLPLRLDSYRGCTYGCLYCFSQSLNNRESGFHYRAVPANPADFIKLMDSINHEGRQTSLVRSCLKRKIPIHFGCVSDPLQPQEIKSRITLKFLKILKQYNYPFILCTKSDLIINLEYLSIIRDTRPIVQISFSTMNDKLASYIEPHAPSPTIRLRTLDKLSNLGIWTVARLQPFLYPKEQINDEGLRSLANVGVKHVTLEHLRIPTNSKLSTRMSLWNALGVNLLETYRNLGIKHSRINYELNSEIKLHNILKAKNIIHKYGMSFGSGDNDFHHASDYFCCCGVPADKSEFSNIYKGNIGYAAYKSLKTGTVSFSCIDEEWQPKGSVREYINSDCRINNLNSIKELFRFKIKNPTTSNSPISFYGIQYFNDKYIINEEIRKKIVR
jgi:DNA repair photolyase